MPWRQTCSQATIAAVYPLDLHLTPNGIGSKGFVSSTDSISLAFLTRQNNLQPLTTAASLKTLSLLQFCYTPF